MFSALKRLTRAFLRRVRALLLRRPGGRKVPGEERAILRHLRKRSQTVDEIARRSKIPSPAALSVLLELESRGLVKLSADQGSGHTRIAALTTAGREALRVERPWVSDHR